MLAKPTNNPIKEEKNMKTNKIFKVLSLILALAMILTVAGCAGKPAEETSKEESKVEESKAEESKTEEAEGETSEEETPAVEWGREGPDDTTEPYAFTIYYNYDWWTIRPFGEDAASAEIEKRFNVDVTLTKPDSDPAAKLNLMVTSGDYPEVIYMDNNSDFRKLIGQGIFVPLSELKYEGNPYDEAFAQSSQNLIAVDGEVYSWPNWIRKGATGGNNTWQVLESVWNANEAPKFQTVEEMYDWLLKVKEAGGLKNAKGQEIAPFMTNNSASGSAILECFLRAQGRPNRPQDWWTQGQGGSEADYTFYLEDEYVIAALKEANKWYNAGLIPQFIFTDNEDQKKEKFTTAQAAVVYYDFSQDSVYRYNQLIKEEMNDRYLVFGWDIKESPIYLTMADAKYPAFGDENSTIGGGGPAITNKAENPGRIFDMFSWMWTKEGSINMMYGPQGLLWDELDENGNPMLKVPEAEIPSEEKDAAGLWFWAAPAHSDNVDTTKFAVNEMAPEDKRDWTISIQANLMSPNETDDDPISLPGQKYICDDNVNVYNTIDSTTDLGVSRKLIEEKCAASTPALIMAKDEAEFDKIVAETIEYVNANGKDEILEKYNAQHEANIEMAGYSYYDLFYEAYQG
jgi:ABC-type glycerol-3-phosphate transport system substrate-binding protein